MLSVISRAMTSVAAPGPVGTIILIERVGQVCALVAPAGTSSSAASSSPRRTIVNLPS